MWDNEIWSRSFYNTQSTAEVQAQEALLEFEQSEIGLQYKETFQEILKGERNYFLRAYNNVSDYQKPAFIQDYRSLLKELLKKEAKGFLYKNAGVWEVPLEELLRYATLQVIKELRENLVYDLLKVYQGSLDIGKPDELTEDEINQDQSLSTLGGGLIIGSKGRKGVHLKFNSLILYPLDKDDLVLRLKQMGVLDENAKWSIGLFNTKTARPLYEALVRLGLMKQNLNIAAVFRAFLEEFGISETLRNFSNPPSEELTEAYVDDLKRLKR